MNDEDAVVRLLTEIRDMKLREQSYRDEVMAMNRSIIARQRRALWIGLVVILIGVGMVVWALLGRQGDESWKPGPTEQDAKNAV